MNLLSGFLLGISVLSFALLFFCLGGLVAEYVMPRCKRLSAWIDTLPIVRDERREDHDE